MKTRLLLPLLLVFALTGRAESAKSYQVTGPIVALTDTMITVNGRGDEKHEITRNPSTKVDGKLAVGSRVTVYYKMVADTIEVKESGKSGDKSEKKKK